MKSAVVFVRMDAMAITAVPGKLANQATQKLHGSYADISVFHRY